MNNMMAGRSKFEVGTRVRVANITDPNDAELNGLTGRLCQPFKGYPMGDVGIRVDPDASGREMNINVLLGEFQLLRKR